MGLGLLTQRSSVLDRLLNRGGKSASGSASDNEEEMPDIQPGSDIPGAPKELNPRNTGSLDLPPGMPSNYGISEDFAGNTRYGAVDNGNEINSPTVNKPEVLKHLPMNFSPSADTPYPSYAESHDESNESQSDADNTGADSELAHPSVAPAKPSALDSARKRLSDFDQPLSRKQILMRSLVQAIPVVAGGLVGATDNGVERVIGEQNNLRLKQRGQLQGDVAREEKNAESQREFDSRQAATEAYREGMHKDRQMRASTMLKQIGDRMMQYNPDSGKYDIDAGAAKTAPPKPIHLIKEGGKTVGANDEEGTAWSNDDPNLPENLKPILTRAQAQDKTNQDEAAAIADKHFKNQLEIQLRAQEASAARQRASFDHQDVQKAHKLVADQALKEANLTMAEGAYKDPDPSHRAINDNTLVMEYIRHTLPNGSRMTNTELQSAWQARKLPDYALHYMDAHFNHELTPDQRGAMIGSVRTAVSASREAASNAAAVYSSGGALSPSQVKGGGAATQGQPSGKISVAAPNGKTYLFDNQAAADNFKKSAGIK